MAKSTLKDFIRLFMIDLILISLAQNSLSSAEVIQKAPPIYGTCTLAKSGGEFQTAICLLKQLCPTCDFGTLNKNSIKVVVRNKEVDSLYITTDRQQSYGLISAKGKVEARVMFGAIIDLCLNESRNATAAGYTLDYLGCVRVAFEGKARDLALPPRLDTLFKSIKFKIRHFADDPVEDRKLTIAELVLTENATICANKFPKGTSFVYHTISTNIPYEVLLPDGATLADGRKPNENQTIDLTDDKFNCAISIREKIVENGD